MKYIKMGWPEIQDYMMKEDYNENVYFDPRKNCWFIPENWEPDDLGLIDLEDVFEEKIND